MIITTHPTMSTSHYPCLWPSQKLFGEQPRPPNSPAGSSSASTPYHDMSKQAFCHPFISRSKTSRPPHVIPTLGTNPGPRHWEVLQEGKHPSGQH